MESASTALTEAGTKQGYQLERNYLAPHRTEQLLERIGEYKQEFQNVQTKAGMNLRYSVLDGHQIRQHLPQLFELARTDLLGLTQEFAGRKLQLMQDPRRMVRIQYYRGSEEGFRWHLDGGYYSALLTLVNTSSGATEVIPPGLSRFLKPIPYVLYPFPGILRLARPHELVSASGDLLLLHGGAAIHRGTNKKSGERMVVVATYDPVDRKANPLWDWVAHRLNY